MRFEKKQSRGYAKIAIIAVLIIAAVLAVSAGDIVAKQGNLNVGDLSASGKVGIGTASPAAKLDVVGQIRSSGASGYFAQLLSYDQVWGNGVKAGYQLQQVNDATHAGYDIIFNNWGTSANAGGFVFANTNVNSGTVRIAPDGSVGIGTPTPGAKLEVKGTFTVNVSAEAGAIRFYYDVDSPNKIRARLSNNKGIVFSDDGDTKILAIDEATTSVGIGTATPEAKLHVKGTVKIEGTSFIAGKVVCVKTDGNLGTCSNVPTASGCTCA